MKLSEIKISKKLDVYRDGSFQSIGKIPYSLPKLLAGCAHEKYLPHVLKNPNIVALICPPEIVHKIPNHIAVATSESVREVFALIQNQLALNKDIYTQYDGITIGKQCNIHPTAIIEEGVIIQDNVCIGPYTVVKTGTVIGKGSNIDANVVLGIQGFEYVPRKNNNTPLRVTHAGRLLIGEYVDIHPGTTVQRGRFADTIINSGVKIDAQCHIGHEVVIGNNTLIASGAMIAGGVKIGENVWVGPMTSLRNEITIGDNAYISIGSMVSRSIQPGEKVSGYFAIPHDKFIDDFKNRMKKTKA